MKHWNIFDRIEPTPAGRAYAACIKAEEDCLDACTAVQEGALPELLDAPMQRQSDALDTFHALTGTHFYHPDSEVDPAVTAGILAAFKALGIEPEGVSEPTPSRLMLPPPCEVCDIANIYGTPSCMDSRCPNPCK